ncbi:hypothetical protein [Duodenibacillus massiliensis]|nr:hypothetical protein [Duodenibacillus massiliensis]
MKKRNTAITAVCDTVFGRCVLKGPKPKEVFAGLNTAKNKA